MNLTPAAGFWTFVIGLVVIEGLLWWLRRHRADKTVGKVAEGVVDAQEHLAGRLRDWLEDELRALVARLAQRLTAPAPAATVAVATDAHVEADKQLADLQAKQSRIAQLKTNAETANAELARALAE